MSSFARRPKAQAGDAGGDFANRVKNVGVPMLHGIGATCDLSWWYVDWQPNEVAGPLSLTSLS